MDFISQKVYTELIQYLKKKMWEVKDYKIMYEDLQQHFQREVEQSEYWKNQWEVICGGLDIAFPKDE